MFYIQLADVDELFSISLELGILAYLQELVQYDKVGDICEWELTFAQKEVESYLLDKQLQMVVKLRELLTKERFVEPA